MYIHTFQNTYYNWVHAIKGVGVNMAVWIKKAISNHCTMIQRKMWELVCCRILIPCSASNMFTTSTLSKYIITPPLVPHGTFFTSSDCRVT